MTGALDTTTLAEALRVAADENLGAAVFHLQDGVVRLTARDLLARAQQRARSLRHHGIEPGDRVAILGPNRPEWVTWAYSVWLAGGTLVPLPFHLRIRDRDVFRLQTLSLLDAADCRVVITDPRFLPDLAGRPALDWNVVARGRGNEPNGDPATAADLAVIQFTSGSTAAPKGAMLTHGNVMAAINMIVHWQRLQPGADRFIGWLPFFHDWGLFGYVLRPALAGCEGHLLPTERFAASPVRWLRLASRVRATLTSGPSSGFRAAFRSAIRRPEGIDLSSLRYCGIAAEAIDPDTIEMMTREGEPLGLRPEAICGGYGMAEATLGLALTPLDTQIRIDDVDLSRLADTREAVPAVAGRVKRVVSCGAPLRGVQIRIVADDGRILADRHAGEIQVRSPSVMRGYTGEQIEQPFDDGWLRTGDLGYLAEGELFVVGRTKDVIISYGQNHAPEDIEWAAERVAGVRPGRVVAFAGAESPEGEVLVVLEPTSTSDVGTLAERVRKAVGDAIGLTPREVLVVPKGTIPKTTSGKLKRNAIRQAYDQGSLPILPVRARARATRDR